MLYTVVFFVYQVHIFGVQTLGTEQSNEAWKKSHWKNMSTFMVSPTEMVKFETQQVCTQRAFVVVIVFCCPSSWIGSTSSSACLC